MQCERCNKKKATVFYRENINGRIKALRLCGDCTEVLEQAGELEDMGTVLSGSPSPLLISEDGSWPFPLFTESEISVRISCPACGEKFIQAAERGQLGCPACYSAFSTALTAPLRVLHGQASHTGRVSSGYRARKEIEGRLTDLREQLKVAIAAEEFERAAALRDEIRKLESTL